MSEGGDLKVFKITGAAAMAYSGDVKKKRVTRKRGGEEDEKVAPVANPSITKLPVINLSTFVSNMTPTASSLEVKQVVPCTPSTINRQNPPLALTVQGRSDDKKIKVELKKKQPTKKVQLHPKKDGPQKVPATKKSETRKKNRKVLLGISSLHKRMTRAKKMHKKVTEMPLDKLRDELISKKLIKSTSKAPESILRQIATDAQIMETKSL